MKKLKFIPLIAAIISLCAACQKSNAVKPGTGIAFKKTTTVMPPVCTGDTSKQFSYYLRGGQGYYIYGNEIATDSAGDIYTIGDFFGNYGFTVPPEITPNPYGGTYIQKINANGSLGWSRQLSEVVKLDAYYNFAALPSIAVDAKGNVYQAILYFNGSVGQYPVYGSTVTKYDDQGNIIWTNTNINLGTFVNYFQPSTIGLDVNGNVYFCSNYNTGSPISIGTQQLTGGGSFVEELDNNGNYVGLETGPPVQNPVLSPNGNLFDYGVLSGEAYIKKFTHSGILAWQHQLGGNTISKLVADVAGNAIVVCGASNYVSGTPVINQNTQLGKYDANGNLVFRYVNCGATNVFTTNAAGDIFMEGYVQGTQDVDPTPGQYFLNSSSIAIYIREFDAEGNFIGAKLPPTGTPKNTALQSMTADASGYLYFSGNVGTGSSTLVIGKNSQCEY